MRDRPEIKSQGWNHVLMLYTKCQEAVMKTVTKISYGSPLMLKIELSQLTGSR
jgi:hypothetical protein